MLPSGGGIRVLREFTGHLAKEFDLTVHVPVGGSLQPAGSSIGEIVYPFPMWKKPSGFLRLTAPLFLIARLISFRKVCRGIADRISNSADVALVHNSMPVAAPPVLQYLSIPSVYFCFEHPRHLYENTIIRRTDSALAECALRPLGALEKRMDRQSAESATQIVTFSTYMQNNIERFYRRKAEIVRPGVNSKFFCPGDQPVDRGRYVLSVGALWKFKGHETVVRILGNVPAHMRPELKIIADREYPGYSAKLHSLADSLSVKISISKNVSEMSLREMYRKAQAVICCQRNEPYGLVPLESMACGTPVIAIQEGGFVDNITEGKTGFLFSGDPEEGAELLMNILKNPGAASTIGSNGILFTRKERTIVQGASRLGEILGSL